MVELLVCNQAVVGSSPVASTIQLPRASNGDAHCRLDTRNAQSRTLASSTIFENKVNCLERGHHEFENKWLSYEECMVDA